MNDVLSGFLEKKSNGAKDMKEVIQMMLADYQGRWDYAADTLESILDWVGESGTITDAQIRAIGNIQDKPSDPYGTNKRRYCRRN